MSIECRCDECGKTIDVGENINCQKCCNALVEKIEIQEERIAYLERIIEEARDE
jgi:hypothetical protein